MCIFVNFRSENGNIFVEFFITNEPAIYLCMKSVRPHTVKSCSTPFFRGLCLISILKGLKPVSKFFSCTCEAFLDAYIVKRSPNQFGYCCFNTAGRTLWCSLPEQLWQPDISFGQFKRSLKTFMFG